MPFELEITEWYPEDEIYKPLDEVFRIGYEDHDGQLYSIILTAEGIEKGSWGPAHVFTCEDNEGDDTQLEFFRLEPLEE